jgi:hypothetical protein
MALYKEGLGCSSCYACTIQSLLPPLLELQGYIHSLRMIFLIVKGKRLWKRVVRNIRKRETRS